MARAVQQYFVHEPRSMLTLPLTSIWVRDVPRSLTSTPLRRGSLAWFALPRDAPPRHRLRCGAPPGLILPREDPPELAKTTRACEAWRSFTWACRTSPELAVFHGGLL